MLHVPPQSRNNMDQDSSMHLPKHHSIPHLLQQRQTCHFNLCQLNHMSACTNAIKSVANTWQMNQIRTCPDRRKNFCFGTGSLDVTWVTSKHLLKREFIVMQLGRKYACLWWLTASSSWLHFAGILNVWLVSYLRPNLEIPNLPSQSCIQASNISCLRINTSKENMSLPISLSWKLLVLWLLAMVESELKIVSMAGQCMLMLPQVGCMLSCKFLLEPEKLSSEKHILSSKCMILQKCKWNNIIQTMVFTHLRCFARIVLERTSHH